MKLTQLSEHTLENPDFNIRFDYDQINVFFNQSKWRQ